MATKKPPPASDATAQLNPAAEAERIVQDSAAPTIGATLPIPEPVGATEGAPRAAEPGPAPLAAPASPLAGGEPPAPRRRGRPPGSKNAKPGIAPAPAKAPEAPPPDPRVVARMGNTAYEMLLVMLLGGDAKLSSDEKTGLDGALAEYIAANNIRVSPLVMLAFVYTTVTMSKLQQPTVVERVGGWLVRVRNRIWKRKNEPSVSDRGSGDADSRPADRGQVPGQAFRRDPAAPVAFAAPATAPASGTAGRG